MSKGNLFLGYARGSVGDVVFTRQGGEQVARGRNRAPRNPQSPLQLIQRVCLKTASQAYSMVQDICNHSFQGKPVGTPNQSAFVKANVDLLRLRAAELINSDDQEAIFSSQLFNYASKQCFLPEVNEYLVSSGSIASLNYEMLLYGAAYCGVGSSDITFDTATEQAPPTYQQVVDAFQLQRGDQLTFLFFSVDDTKDDPHFNGFEFSRVILEPSDGDMTSPFLTHDQINKPNVRNEGLVKVSLNTDKNLVFLPSTLNWATRRTNSLAGGAIIVSRMTGDVWQRSTQSVVLRPWDGETAFKLNKNHGTGYLGDAVISFIPEANSSLYLNQATL